jgi:hypothetical protein
MSGAAYRDRGFGGAAEMDRKRIKEALEKHTERPSPSTSRGASREKELLAAGKITTTIGKVPKVSDVGEDLAVRRAMLLLLCTALPALAGRLGLCYFRGRNHMLRCHCILVVRDLHRFLVCSETQETGITALAGAGELVPFLFGYFLFDVCASCTYHAVLIDLLGLSCIYAFEICKRVRVCCRVFENLGSV